MTARLQESASAPPLASKQMIDIGRRMIANIVADTTDHGARHSSVRVRPSPIPTDSSGSGRCSSAARRR